ncbi:MAG: hypothetical protein ACXWC0_03860 [Burkholderiales bacterium]
MLAQDNPGELWVERGARLFYEKRGPKNVSLERCDLGLGPGKVEGAFAQLPRYFADTAHVQDLESRLMTCMIDLQGFQREDIIRDRFGSLDKDSDVEALVSFIGSKSNGMRRNTSTTKPVNIFSTVVPVLSIFLAQHVTRRKANGSGCRSCQT